MPHLRRSTVRVSRGIFVRFLVVVVGVNALVGSGVIVYDIAAHIWTTREHLHHTSNVIARVATELRRISDKSDRDVVIEAGLSEGDVVALEDPIASQEMGRAGVPFKTRWAPQALETR